MMLRERRRRRRLPGSVINLQRRRPDAGLDAPRAPDLGAQSWRSRYLLAAAASLLTAALHLPLAENLPRSPFLIYVPAVVLSGVYGGWSPVLLAAALSSLCAVAVTLAPSGADGPWPPGLGGGLALFLLVAASISYLSDLLHESVRAMRRQSERFRRLIDSVRDYAIFTLDAEGRVTSWNTGAERMKGYRAEEIVGRHFSAFYPPEDAGKPAAELAAAVEKGSAEDEGWRVRKDGSRFWANVVLTSVRDERGRVLGFTKVTRDLTERRRAEEAARERYLRTIIDSQPALIAYIDNERRYVFNNRAYEDWFGVPIEALKGRSMKDVLGEELYERTRPHVDAALSGRAQSFEISLDTERFGRRWVHAQYVPNLAADGAVNGFFVFAQDLTERRTAEEAVRRSERQLRTIMDNFPGLVSYIDASERYVFNNVRYRDWFGVEPESLRGRKASLLLGASAESILPNLRRALRGEEASFELEFAYRDRSRWVHADFLPDRDASGVRGVFVFVIDISEHRHHAEELERAVAERTEALRRTVAELQAFSYTISHDLRAPLRAIQGYAHLLGRRLGEGADEESARMLARMSDSALRMDRLIQDLLVFGRLSREDYKMYPLALEPIVDHILAHYPGLEKAEIVVRRPLARVVGQDSLLTQALSNLIANAAKFTAPGRPARIELRTDPAGPGRVRVTVEDNGIGVPDEMRARLFQPFQRLHPSEGYEGTGIGLAIVKKAAERMGGTAGMDSIPGDGSRFWIELPEAPA